MALNNQKCIGEQDLCSRSDAPQQKSNRQGTGTANQQNQRKLSFKLHLPPMKLETMLSTILLRKYHMTLSTRRDQILLPAIPNTTRNYVENNSAENISQDLVQPTVTTPDTQASASFDFESGEREEITDVPAPAPTPALERIEEQSTHTPGSRKSTRKNFGKPACSFSDF